MWMPARIWFDGGARPGLVAEPVDVPGHRREHGIGGRERGGGAGGHHREGAGFGADGAAAHGGVEELVAARPEARAEPPGEIRRHRAGQHHGGAAGEGRDAALRAEQHLVGLLGGGDHDDQQLRLGRRRRGARGRLAARRREAGDGLGTDVEATDGEAGREKPGGHSRSHRAETDEADAPSVRLHPIISIYHLVPGVTMPTNPSGP
jgi:hypothetical protein